MIEPVEIPSWLGQTDDPARLIALIDDWAASLALAEVIASWGASRPSLDGAALLAWLDGFAGDHWDFRRGRERNHSRHSAVTSPQSDIIISVAARLGLADVEIPSRRRYDTVIMTGGMVRAGIVKPRFVVELIESGLDVDTVVFLGGFRPFSGDEIALAAALGVKGDDEFAAMTAGLELAFGPLGVPTIAEEVGPTAYASWREVGWEVDGLSLRVLAAPSSDPESRRANSADTYRFWADHRRTPGKTEVLQVTTPIYVPYQAAVATEILGVERGMAIDTVGVSATARDLGEFSQPFLAHHHLQELRSAIGAMVSLRASATRPRSMCSNL